MARYKIEAFVIRANRITESSRVLTLYSREMGKVKAVAKGVGRPKSRLGGKVELFNLIEGDLYKKESSELGILSGAGLQEDFKGITDNPRRYGFASAWCEVLDKTSHSEEPHPETFQLTFDYLKALQQAKPEAAGLLFWGALMQFLVLEGYGPGLDACVSCGKPPEMGRLMISLQRGGLIGPECVEYDEPVVSITPQALELLKKMEDLPLEELTKLQVDTGTGRLVAEVILSLASYHLGLPRNLKSFRFLEDLTESGRMGR
jgi:DNA repair protein RecO (recombination protein O)